MTEEIKFDDGLIVKGQWTQSQLDLMQSLMDQIKVVMSKRFPELSENLFLTYNLPKEGVGAKINAEIRMNEELSLGFMNQEHMLEAFSEHPEETQNLLKALFNDTTVLAYYQLLEKAITSVLSYVTKRADEENMCDQGRFFVKKKKVIPLPFIPEDVVVMHPNTIKNLKRDSR